MVDDETPHVEVLREELRLAQAIIEGLSPDTMGAVDHDLRYLALNSATQEQLVDLYGRRYEPGDLVTDGMSDEMAEASRQVWRRALSGESWLLRQSFGDRETYTYESRFFPLRDEDGEIFGAAGWGRNVTERVRREEALIESNEALDQFASVASHDLRTPLRGVAAFVKLAVEVLDEGDRATFDDLIARITRQLDRMDRLISDLLAYSRNRTRPVSAEPVALDDLVDHAIDEARIAHPDRPIVVEREPLPSLTGDATRLQQLVSNLIDNAVKYTDGDEVRIGITDRSDDDDVVFSVHDEGIGIPAEHRKAIFEPFRRLHGADEFGGGSGVGLAIVAQVAEQQGGEVTVTSAPVRGSAFEVRLRRKPLPPITPQR